MPSLAYVSCHHSHAHGHRPIERCVDDTPPFANAEQAWLWCAKAHAAGLHRAPEPLDRPRSARAAAMGGAPCHPAEVARIVDRLYRQLRLTREHLATLARYGRRALPPNPERRREMRDASLWEEAMERIEPALRSHGLTP
jgi:hypothetical protein